MSGAARSRSWQRVDAVLAEALAAGVMPGAALIVGCGDDVLLERTVGGLEPQPSARRVGPDTLYDLSSLTKPLATVSSLLLLAGRAALAFDTPVAEVLPEFVDDAEALPRHRNLGAAGDALARLRGSITVGDLMAHRSGLPAHRRYFEAIEPSSVETAAGAQAILALAAREPLEAAPRERAVYSDVGFVLLGEIVARIAGQGFDRFVRDAVLRPLGLARTGFAGGATRLDDPGDTAPCGSCAWRGAVVRGKVQDENAYAMGGVAGHAGLFSTARDVHRLVAELVRAYLGGVSIFTRSLVRACWSPARDVPASTWALGWDTPSPAGSSAGRRVSPSAVGHLGFTGTSIWIDLERGIHVVLLTNRLHPDPTNVAIRDLRPRLHDAIWESLD